MLTLYLAGGCFWGVEKYFAQFRGVQSTEVGYANGPASVMQERYSLEEHRLYEEERSFSEEQPPSYEEVCAGYGFAETVKVEFDPAVLPAKTLLGYFFEIIDPLAVNRQGPDIGVQYRTGIYYEASQEAELLPAIREVVAAKENELHEQLATEVEPLRNYYPAEKYHQNYLKKHPFGYCHIPKRHFFRQYAADKDACKEDDA